ncbi:Predicted Zn-dependent peptidase [Carnobacterium iners]|uniref:Predicted Zn-dependent peptidase n=1 Tax=Carnobacterium iners TaxID=1073423 RepID=A0A1X7NQY4_9LACT|nr:pitrilysin family protein [Carnobacterium iners]SEK25893.1 Predicted Zn-dependent peptidase [Carnobacterium iners]SMH40467.1 Predicted Zn-dependent peptidase [Carnobacterium iners]
MSIQLTEGVNLHIMPTEKYKTVRIVIKFRAPLDKKTITKRALLSSLLETNSKKYPTQTALRSELSNLFGASFGSSVTKKGAFHVLTLSLNVVNEKYLTMSDSILAKSIDFLKEIIFNPNVTNEHFNQATFVREKENLVDYYDSITDDKQTYANLELQKLFFEEDDQKIPSIGIKEDLAEITEDSLYHYYKKMLQQDQVDIYVLGAIDEDQLVKQFKEFSFESRKLKQKDLFYTPSNAKEIKIKIEQQEIKQAKFNLGYTTPIFYLQENYYAGQLFNGLFGGFPHSKLFVNVREKESLAYYASSSLDTFRGMMIVQTGIDSKKMEKVKEIVTLQLKEMQTGNFTEEDIYQTKQMLKNQLLQSEDNSSAVIERTYSNQLAKNTIMSIEEWMENIEKVTKEEIIGIANLVHLKATFFLSEEVK